MPTGERPIAWRWSDALYGFVCAVPAALVALGDVPHGRAFVALSLLAYGTTGAEAAGRLNERVAETLLGVALAFVFGTLLPRAESTDGPQQWLRRPGPSR